MSTTVIYDATDTLIAATINTTETPFAKSYAIPANYFTTGRPLKIELCFDETTSASAVTQRFRLRLGTTASVITGGIMYDTGAALAVTNAMTSRTGLWMCWLIGTAAAGASVSLACHAAAYSAGATAITIHPWALLNTVAQPVAAQPTNGVLYVTPTIQYGGNTAGNQITLPSMIVTEY